MLYFAGPSVHGCQPAHRAVPSGPGRDVEVGATTSVHESISRSSSEAVLYNSLPKILESIQEYPQRQFRFTVRKKGRSDEPLNDWLSGCRELRVSSLRATMSTETTASEVYQPSAAAPLTSSHSAEDGLRRRLLERHDPGPHPHRVQPVWRHRRHPAPTRPISPCVLTRPRRPRRPR